MALVETFTDDFSDDSNWTDMGSADATLTPDTPNYEWELLEGGSAVRLSVPGFEIQNSWASIVVDGFQQGMTESYVDANFGLTKGDFSMYFINTYASYPGGGATVRGGFASVNGTSLAEPFQYGEHPGDPVDSVVLALSMNEGEYTAWCSLDGGDTWDSHTVDLGDLSGEFFLYLGARNQSDDPLITLNFHSLNEIAPPGFGEPELTEVDKTLDVAWNIQPFMLRHSTRHLHRSVFEYLDDQLTSLGWTVPGRVPFNATPVALQDLLPEEFEEESLLVPGTVAVTVGDEPEVLGQEMGGPLALIEVPIFIDVFMEDPGTTLALALDVRDIFCGRLPGTSRYLKVKNYASYPAVELNSYTVEFEDVIRQNQKKNWETVKITACLYFPDSEGN